MNSDLPVVSEGFCVSRFRYAVSLYRIGWNLPCHPMASIDIASRLWFNYMDFSETIP